MKAIIYNKLNQQLNPTHLEVLDESHLHQGHKHNTMQGDSHFKVIISAPLLQNKTKLEQHKAIYGILDYEIKNQIHAIAIQVI
jgi:BolA protein